ncbi:hypothetical protein Dimus_008202 [Dionaea muscipula]
MIFCIGRFPQQHQANLLHSEKYQLRIYQYMAEHTPSSKFTSIHVLKLNMCSVECQFHIERKKRIRLLESFHVVNNHYKMAKALLQTQFFVNEPSKSTALPLGYLRITETPIQETRGQPQ